MKLHRLPPPLAVAFTLVELLLVVSIIAILLAILVPSLSKAMALAASALCGSNESGHGKALALLLNDQKRRYPVIQNYPLLMGNKGAAALMGADHHTGSTRPLNPYLGYKITGATDPIVKIAQCPSDLGDPVLNVSNAYVALGVSYMPQMCYDDFRTRHVFGWDGHGQAPVDSVTKPLSAGSKSSMSHSAIERMDNKIILADWPWHGDRLYSDERTRWHDDERRRFNTLFADGHVELFYFDPSEVEIDRTPPKFQEPFNSSFQWW